MGWFFYCNAREYNDGLGQLAFDLQPQRRVFTVAELNTAIRAVLDSGFNDLWVSGEISGLKLAQSGHAYFTLKDRSSQIRCVCFKSSYRYLKFKPQDGICVLARGRIDVFEARGEYQLLVELLEPQGLGALQFAFERLKEKLRAEGLFAAERKRPLPNFPIRVGIVTSPGGAVIRDFLNVLERRFAGLHIRIFPALVQGEGSILEVCRGIDYFSHSDWAHVVVIARGGGSLEDLWTFNEEPVARAIAACSLPVISAIGHETDFTIADFVADLRAPTPSAAAELLICTRQEILDRVAARLTAMMQSQRYRFSMLARRLQQQGVERATANLQRAIGRKQQRIDEIDARQKQLVRDILQSRQRRWRDLDRRLRVFDMRPRLALDRNRLDRASSAALQTIRLRLAKIRRTLETQAAHLAQLSPLKVLDRGYAIVTGPRGELLRDASSVAPDSDVEIRLAAGRLRARVIDKPALP